MSELRLPAGRAVRVRPLGGRTDGRGFRAERTHLVAVDLPPALVLGPRRGLVGQVIAEQIEARVPACRIPGRAAELGEGGREVQHGGPVAWVPSTTGTSAPGPAATWSRRSLRPSRCQPPAPPAGSRVRRRAQPDGRGRL